MRREKITVLMLAMLVTSLVLTLSITPAAASPFHVTHTSDEYLFYLYGTAYVDITVCSHYSADQGFKIMVISDQLPNQYYENFYMVSRDRAYGVGLHVCDSGWPAPFTMGWGEFGLEPGGSITLRFTVDYNPGAIGTYHIEVGVGKFSDPHYYYEYVGYTYVHLTSGGCPNLLVWNGGGFVDEGVLNIHNLVNPESDVVVEHTLAMTPALTDHHRYTLRLAEIGAGYSYSHSWIDQVRLYSVDDEGVWHRLSLVFANSSRYGNVLSLLLRSDDEWTQTFKGDEITLQFIAPRLDNIAEFVFVIEGHNSKQP